MKNSDFAHLHCHTEYSLLDGLGSPSTWAERASDLGFKAIAVTDHGSADAAIKFQQACDEHEVKAIIGCEAYIVLDILIKEKDEKRYHTTLLVKNATGWKNLLQLLTKANLKGFYYRPRIDPSMLLEHCEGLVVMTGCCSTFLRMPTIDEFLPELLSRTEVVGEIMPLIMPLQYETNSLVIEKAINYGFNLVATNDCHYVLKEDNLLQEVLLAMQRKDKWSNPERWKFDIDDLYLKSANEMIDSFESQAVIVDRNIYLEAMKNTVNVANLCNFRIEQRKPSLPEVYVEEYDGYPEEDQLIQLVMDGLDKRASSHDWIRDNIAAYEERIYEELEQIMPQFTRYFLIVWELISWCNKNDIMVGGRGSSAGSLVSYCLGITRLDPIKYSLVFSRFISEGRIDLPDIDMDFEDRRRDDVKKHLADTYGKWNVIEVSTFLKMHGRGAIRDVSRVFDIPLLEVDKAAKCIIVRSGGDFRSDFTLEDAFSTFEDGRKFREKYPEVTNIAMRLEGTVKASGRHAAGVCVSKHDLRTGENANFVVRKGVNVCNWDKEDAEYMGLMKLDVLGLNALTILSEAKDLIKDRHGIDLDYNLIDLDDDKIYEQFTAGNTVGIFQFGSGSMIKLCRDIHGENFDQVVAINALHRPGALRSGYTQIYRDRKFGTVDTEYVHPWIEGITKDTQGLIIYQEQVMRLMYELGGLPWKTADTIRKVISKSKGVEEFMKFEEEFIAGCKRLGTLSESDAKTIFGELKNTGSYSFNKSHACEYSLTGVWQMYLKVYYPIEFMTALLSYGPANKKGELINEAKRLGIKINLPDINKSMADTWAIGDDNSLLSPLREVKGIGEVASKEIVECRGMQGAFKDDLDLESKVEKRKVNKKVRDLLVKVKAYEKSKDKLNLPEDELEELSQYFDFELSNDPLHRYRGAIAKIANNIGLINLSESYNTGDKSNFFFGRMDSLRVGYRAAVGQTAGSGSFGSMGGVYGNLKDDTDFKMLIFGNKIYNEKKDVIEHCEGEAILTYAYNSDDKAALMTQNAWFGDEILSGDLDGVKPELGDFTKNDLSGTYLDGCDGCELIKECTSPVYPSNGQMNVMLIGEAPGKLEDKKGMGFIGQSGKILWDIFREYRLSRELFYINNVVKCFPSITKTPKKKHVTACSKWLKREIDIVKPFLILSFGNTGNLFFRGESTGIMSINATTAWNNEYNCWITYSVHPAMATYNPENLPLLEESISEFAKKLEILM